MSMKQLNRKLREACLRGEAAAVEALLLQGADINSGDDRGITPLQAICLRGDRRETALFLLDRGAEVDARDNSGWTPLHSACCNGNRKTALLLLDRGAEVDARDNNGQTPLHEACSCGRRKTALLLIDRGAEADAMDNSGETPLHRACGHGNWDNYKTALLLVSRGADVDVTNNEGETPLDVTRVRVVPDDYDGDDYDNQPVDEKATEATRNALRRERKKYLAYLAWMRRKAFLAVLSESGCLQSSHQQQQSLSQPLGEVDKDTLVERVFRVAHRDIASYI